MYIQILLALFFFIYPLPHTEAQRDARESEVLRNIVFMRTEGLGMIELFQKHSPNKQVRNLCLRVITYYKETQPALLELCRGKDLQLSQAELKILLERLQKGFEGYNADREGDYLQWCEEHINKSIALYAALVQEQRWEDITHFSFTALPGLFNLQQEISKTKKR